MSCYNDEAYIKEAIDSILQQTFTDFEFIIINDGSEDKTEAIVLSYNDDRIRYFYQENKGLAKALNNGLSHARGKYIARIDSDDIAYPDRLEIQVNHLLDNPDCVVLGTNVENITQEGEFVYTTYQELEEKKILDLLKYTCPIAHTSVIFDREIALKCGGYYEPIKQYFEDHYLWSKMKDYGKLINIPQVTMKYRLRPNSITNKYKTKEYLELVKNVIEKGFINESELKRLFEIKKKEKSSLRKSIAIYHLLLGKKYLWNNYNRSKAIANLKLALKNYPINLQICLLFIVSFLPKNIIKFIYSSLK
jgi:glycosyltransferase involved in cell wall biosynthesis